MARIASPLVLSCLATMIGCHLIGGVSDLQYVDDASGGAGTGTGTAAPGGGGEGGAGGAGGTACPIDPCEEPCCVDCMPVGVGTSCEGPGICDGSGFCAVGALGPATIYGGEEREEAAAVVALGDGRLFVAGHSTQGAPVPFGGGVELESGPTAAFLAGFEPNGTPSWTWRLASVPAGGDRRIRAMAVAADDAVVVGGSFSAHVALVTNVFTKNTFEAESTSSDSDEDAFVGLIDSDGNGEWLWSSGGATTNQTIHDVAALGDYVVAVGTTGPGTFTFAGQAIGDTSEIADSGFVLVFDAADGGEVVGASWSCLGATATGVATTPDGGIWVVGSYSGAGCIVSNAGLAFQDAGNYPYIARFELDTSTPPSLVTPTASLQPQGYGGASKAVIEPRLDVVESAGGVVIAGKFRNQASNGIDFGRNNVVSNDTSFFRPFIVAFDAEGARWVRDIGGAGDIAINHLASDGAGNVILAGNLESNGSVVESPFNYNNNDTNLDGFLMKFAAVDGGDVLWGLGSSAPDEDRLESVAASPVGRVWAVGWGIDSQLWGAPMHPDLTDYNIVLFEVEP